MGSYRFRRDLSWLRIALPVAIFCFIGSRYLDGTFSELDFNKTLIVLVLAAATGWYFRRRPAGKLYLDSENLSWRTLSGHHTALPLSAMRRVIVQEEIDQAMSGSYRLDIKVFMPGQVHTFPISDLMDYPGFLQKLEATLVPLDVNVLHLDRRGRIARSLRDETAD